ncbi:MAG: class I SAM-dependent methyltransferase [Rhodothermia bacterium]|nr:MAG: class I SAM-dependent methyltransferase [Rhodothermia bacterium]
MQTRTGTVKSLVRGLAPETLVQWYDLFKLHLVRRKNRNRTLEEIFTEIYDFNKWGGSKGELCSGAGTDDEQTVSAYTTMIAEKASVEGFGDTTFVDLGCGDFRVGKQLLPMCADYIGVDVVKPLIRENQEKFGGTNTHFMHLDIVKNELPDGDVCFIRQVLQHLSNEQIVSVLEKLRKYKWVFITEHYPTDSGSIKSNMDKVHGADIRLYDNSGVYFTEFPFELPERLLTMVLEVPGVGMRRGYDQGVIRTYCYKPERGD